MPLAFSASPTLPRAARRSLSCLTAPPFRPTVLPARKVTVSAPRPRTFSSPCDSEAITTSSPCNSSLLSAMLIPCSIPGVARPRDLARGPAFQFLQVEVERAVVGIQLLGGQPALPCLLGV